MDDNENTIVIFGGGLVEEDGKFRTSNFGEGDTFGILGDRLRVEAANVLFQHDSSSVIIALGGKGQYRENSNYPPIANVIKQELIELGIPETQIIEETESGSTYQQLLALLELRRARGGKSFSLITNRYHIPRVSSILKNQPELSELNSVDIKLKEAEKVLLEHEPERWLEIIERAYNSEAMIKRIEQEKHGIQQIESGEYKFR